MGRLSRSRPGLRLLSALLAIGLSFCLWCLPLERLQSLCYDLAVRLRPFGGPHPHIALIAFDDGAALRHRDASHTPVSEILAVLERLQSEQVRALVLLGPFDARSYSEEELRTIGRAVDKFPRALIGFTDDATLERPVPEALSLPGRFLSGVVSRDSFSFGADQVTRRVLLSVDGMPTVYGAVACRYGPVALRKPSAGVLNDVEGADETRCLNHLRGYERNGSRQAFVDWKGGTDSYPRYSSSLVAEGQVPPGTFLGKYVLFGSALRERRDADFIVTPFSKEPLRTPLLEGAAQGLATLLDDSGVLRAPTWMSMILTLLLGALTANLALAASPLRGLGVCLAVLVGVVGSYFLVFYTFHYVMDPVHPLLAAALCYYFAIPYRLFEEYEKRWHYQEKSEYVSELERMKSNFLSLVSHDLRTPIARIQGAAELLISDRQTPDGRERSVRAIAKSAEDLGEYIESVLDLTRVETAKLPLDRSSRDLNETVRQAVQQKKGLAEEKHVDLVLDMYPLFAFRFDERLVRRVIGNLVENAVKYSPHDTTVCVKTGEKPGYATVTVEDQGIGIAPEDQPKVFDKFFRTQAADKHGKGIGLGLYLVKYFVELHGGFVELESRPSEGSRFTVNLPI